MRPTHTLLWILVLTATLSTLGCGGGGVAAAPDPVTLELRSEETLDGRVNNLGGVDFTGAAHNAFTGDSGIGLLGINRQLYAFPLSTIPSGATIVRATLRLYQVRVEGSPYTKLGNVVVDHVDYVGAPGAATYDGQDLSRNVGTLCTETTEGYKTLDVTAQVAANVAAGHDWSQYRLRFYKPGITIYDLLSDHVNFIDGENDDWIANAPPYLDVVYLP